MDNDRINKIAKGITAKSRINGDPWKVRDELQDKLEKLAKKVGDIGIWESGYEFTSDYGSTYRQNVNKNMETLIDIVEKAVEDIEKASDDVDGSERR